MPTYEYVCGACRKRHEIFQSITAKPLTTCPRCGGRMKRLLGTGSGFIFRGSGFYITDYRSKSYTDAKRKDESSSSAPAKVTAKPSSDGSKPRGRGAS